jgi:hypothetical protein
MEARRLALLQNVLEEVPALRLKASERIVTGKNTTRERFEQVFLANYACGERSVAHCWRA